MENELRHIIQQCKQEQPTAQKELYGRYAPLFMAIAMRYMKTKEAAEDVMLKAFYKIFSNVKKFKGEGSFEGWMKRILVNEALMEIRKKNNLHMTVELSEVDRSTQESVVSDMQFEQLLEIMNEMPVGYKTVFNLYVLEGYKHREIAELLGISINTSKSQLILAKRKMQDLLKKKGLLNSKIS